MATPSRYDYILIAVLLSSAYAVSHLAGSDYDAYLGVWMLIAGVGICLWFLHEGLAMTGKVINMKVPGDGKRRF